MASYAAEVVTRGMTIKTHLGDGLVLRTAPADRYGEVRITVRIVTAKYGDVQTIAYGRDEMITSAAGDI